MASMLTAAFLFLLLCGVITLLLLRARGQFTPEDGNDADLEEWTCPDCGFVVQAGDLCTYCYAKKPAQIDPDRVDP